MLNDDFEEAWVDPMSTLLEVEDRQVLALYMALISHLQIL